jgi:hypothetical protein
MNNNNEFLKLSEEQSRLIGLLRTNPPNSAEIRNRLTAITIQLNSYTNQFDTFNPYVNPYTPPSFNPYTPPMYTPANERPQYYNRPSGVIHEPHNILDDIFTNIYNFFSKENQGPSRPPPGQNIPQSGPPPNTNRPPPRTNVPPPRPPQVDPNQIHYDVFNRYLNIQNMAVISSSSENKDISKAYKKLAVKYHPDKGGDADIFKIIGEAYDAIKKNRGFNGGAQKQRRKTKKLINRKKTI